MNKKRGQITIFVIIAIVIVAGLILFFSLKGKINIPGFTQPVKDIRGDIDKCVRDSVVNAVDIMLPQGGFITPENYKLYQDKKISYLCYNKNFYQTCVNQVPQYIDHLTSEIKRFISGKVKDCFYNIEKDYRSKGYNVDTNTENINVILIPKQVRVEISKKMIITKGDDTKEYNQFVVNIPSPVYDLGIIAIEITNQEARYCNFENIGFSLLYNNYLVERQDLDGQTKIYSVKEKDSGKILWFATRSCALPAGL